MIRSGLTALGLLCVCLVLGGCGDMSSTTSKPRTGAVGVTAEGIDDLAKPASKDAAP